MKIGVQQLKKLILETLNRQTLTSEEVESMFPDAFDRALDDGPAGDEMDLEDMNWWVVDGVLHAQVSGTDEREEMYWDKLNGSWHYVDPDRELQRKNFDFGTQP